MGSGPTLPHYHTDHPIMQAPGNTPRQGTFFMKNPIDEMPENLVLFLRPPE